MYFRIFGNGHLLQFELCIYTGWTNFELQIRNFLFSSKHNGEWSIYFNLVGNYG